MKIFAIESSCDETSVCIIKENKDILSHITYSQQEHAKFGGVIPELASRSHLQILQNISKKALKESDLRADEIDVFCATCGPGLIGGLIIGSTYGKSMALGAKKPFLPINHLEGHMLSPTYNNSMKYPYLCFLLTGGHTQIYLIKSINNYELIGETLDDAIGEAFDKVSKILNMPYPGGPEIENIAKKGNISKYELPHPLIKNKSLDFSFSGIKTSVNLIVKKNLNIDQEFKADLAASFQNKISEILQRKLDLVLRHLKGRGISISQVAIVGGVAANKYIKDKLQETAKKNNCSIVLPTKFMLSDNAAMLGWACIIKNNRNYVSNLNFKPNPRLAVS